MSNKNGIGRGTVAGCGAGILAVGFLAGYILKTAISPITPPELLSKLEERMTENPAAYEEVIDRGLESFHNFKADANPGRTAEGAVEYRDLRLVLKETPEGNFPVLVNNNAEYEGKIQYVNGRTTVGSFEERYETVKFEAKQRGMQMASEAKKKAKGLADSMMEKANEMYDLFAETVKNYLPSNGEKVVQPEIGPEQAVPEVVAPEQSYEGKSE
ncbi:MAG: hypothetical protein ABIH72_02690 [archaeon]